LKKKNQWDFKGFFKGRGGHYIRQRAQKVAVPGGEKKTTREPGNSVVAQGFGGGQRAWGSEFFWGTAPLRDPPGRRGRFRGKV